jgi:hypothetical protein
MPPAQPILNTRAARPPVFQGKILYPQQCSFIVLVARFWPHPEAIL